MRILPAVASERRLPGIRTRAGIDTLALASGTIVTGILAYAFIALVTRTIGAAAASPIAVLWTYWSASAAVLVFPLQHWIAQRAQAEGGDPGVRGSLAKLVPLAVLLSLLSIAVAWWLRGQLFEHDGTVFPAAVGAITLGSCFVGIVRGRLAAGRRFTAVAGAIIGENALRVGVALLVTAAGASAESYAVALASGPLVGLAWPSTWRDLLGAQSEAHSASFGFLGGIASGSLVAQLVLTSGPAVLAVIGGKPADVTALFAALALYRAPYLIALGVVTQLTGYLTDLVVSRREDVLRRIRTVAGALTIFLAGLGGLVAYRFGPELVALVFGDDVWLPSQSHAWLVVGTAAALGNLVVSLILVARRIAGRLASIWALGTALGAPFILLTSSPLSGVVRGFAVAEVVVFTMLIAIDANRSSRSASGSA